MSRQTTGFEAIDVNTLQPVVLRPEGARRLPVEMATGGPTLIPHALVAAYLETRYEVLVDPPFVQRVGRPCPELMALMRAHAVSTAVTITAWNPESAVTPPLLNAGAQAELVAALNAGGWRHLPVFGHDPSGEWPGEESRLVLGIPRAAAAALGRRFRQNAITIAGADGVPALLLLR